MATGFQVIYFLSPFFNEEEFIGKFLTDLTKAAKNLASGKYQIILINDGSVDNSLKIVSKFQKKYPVKVITFKRNKGVDAAFRIGFEEIFKVSKGSDLIITLESDNTSDLKILPKMLKKSKQSDLVLASCYAKGGGIYGTGFFRQASSKVANILLYSAFPIKNVKTYSSFYRCYKVETFKKAWDAYDGKLINRKGFICMVEMLIKLAKLPVDIKEVPMILRWEERKGKSKMKITRTIFGYWLIFNDLFIKEKLSLSHVFANARDKWVG